MENLIQLVAELHGLLIEEVQLPGRRWLRVKSRSVLFFWSVRELETTATELVRQFGMSQAAVSIAVQRGERLVREQGWDL